MNAYQGPNSIKVFLIEVQATLTQNSVIDAGLLDFEPGGLNKDIYLVLGALKYWACLCDFGNAFALGVDQGDVWPVKSWQVLVVEAWTLTHQHVPGLQRFSGFRIVD